MTAEQDQNWDDLINSLFDDDLTETQGYSQQIENSQKNLTLCLKNFKRHDHEDDQKVNQVLAQVERIEADEKVRNIKIFKKILNIYHDILLITQLIYILYIGNFVPGIYEQSQIRSVFIVAETRVISQESIGRIL